MNSHILHLNKSTDRSFNKSTWHAENGDEIMAKLILFLISPVLALIYSIYKIKYKSSYVIIFLFCITFGMAFSVPNIRESGGVDGISYRMGFEEICQYSNLSFVKALELYSLSRGGEYDIAFPLLCWLLSKFTSNYHFLFFTISIFFSWFQLKSLSFLTRDSAYKMSYIGLVLFGLFTFNQIFNINGCRFWTAAWIATYAAFMVVCKGKKKFLFLALVAALVHVSFWIFFLILLLSLSLGKWHKAWFITFCVSFFLGTIVLDVLQNLTDILPPMFSDKIEYYANDEYIQEQKTSGTGYAWVSRMFGTIVNIYLNVLVLIIALKSGLKKDKSLYGWVLMLVSFCNMTMIVPSLGGRFINVAIPFIVVLWYRQFGLKGKYQSLISVAPIVFFMNIYFYFILYSTVTPISFWYSSPLYDILHYLL